MVEVELSRVFEATTNRRGFIGGVALVGIVPIVSKMTGEFEPAQERRDDRWPRREITLSTFLGMWGDEKNFPEIAQKLERLGLNAFGLAFQTRSGSLAALEAADKTSLGVIVNEEGDVPPVPDLFSNFSDAIIGVDSLDAVLDAKQIYGGHRSLLGYGVWDEPPSSMIPAAADLVRKFREVEPGKLALIGALPQYTWGPFGSVADWTAYIDEYSKLIDCQVLGIDYYPFLEVDGGHALEETNVFLNLGYMRRKALAKGVPMLTYVQSVGDVSTLAIGTMTVDRIRLQVYYSLAYGAQAISYFEVPGGLIDIDTLAETSLYAGVAEINRAVRRLSPTLMRLKSTGVYQSGEVNNPFDDQLSDQSLVASMSDGLILGTFEGFRRGTYLLPVNRDYVSGTEGEIRFTSEREIFEVVGGAGQSKAERRVGRSDVLRFEMAAGEGRLYRVM